MSSSRTKSGHYQNQMKAHSLMVSYILETERRSYCFSATDLL